MTEEVVTAEAEVEGAGTPDAPASRDARGRFSAKEQQGLRASVTEELARRDAASKKGGDTTAETDDDEADSTETQPSEVEDAGKTAASDDGSAFEPTAAQIDLAKQVGCSDEEIEGFNEADFARVGRLARIHSKAMSELGRAKAKLDEDRAKMGERTVSEAEADKTEQLADFTDDDWYGATGAEKFNKALAKVRTLEETVRGLSAALQERQDAEEEASIDAFFGGLPSTTYPQFGEGPMARLAKGSTEQTARLEVLDLADQIRDGAGLRGKSVSLQSSLEMAVNALHAEDKVRAAKKTTRDAINKRSKARIAAPSSRAVGGGEPRNEREAIIRRVEELRAEHGI